MTSKHTSTFEMLMAASASAANQESPRSWPANPFPKGIRPGSVTDKVRAVTHAAYPKWFEHHELMNLTGGSRGGIAWAVKILQGQELLRSIESSKRPGYRRYQAVATSMRDDGSGRATAMPSLEPARYEHVESNEPARTCMVCGNLAASSTCLAAVHGEWAGSIGDCMPVTSAQRRCLAYIPPRLEFDEILGRDRRTGPELWPEVAALAALELDEKCPLGRAVVLLVRMLQSGPRQAAQIVEAGRAMNISDRTLQRAAEALELSRTKSGFERGWIWALPRQEEA